MVLGRDDLIASVASLARVDGAGRARVAFPDRVANAAAAGFAAVGTSPGDYLAIRATGLSDADIAAMLDDHGLVIGEIDGCPVWLGDEEADADDAFEARLAAVFHMAERFGPIHHTVVPVATAGESLPPTEVLAERCGALAERASSVGMLVAIEFVPWGALADAGAAWDLARRSGHAACGITVDFWHHHTGSGDAGLLRSVPGDRVHAVHLTDGDPDLSEPVALRRTMTQRRVPGEGVFPVVDTIRLLDAIGADLPYTVEVVSLPHRHLPPAEFAKVLHDAAQRALDDARLTGSGRS